MIHSYANLARSIRKERYDALVSVDRESDAEFELNLGFNRHNQDDDNESAEDSESFTDHYVGTMNYGLEP